MKHFNLMHFIDRCQACGDVIKECECPSNKPKPVRWVVCSECKDKFAPVHGAV